MARKPSRRSDCPINFALQTFGDTWSLLIIRDIVYFGKRTYGEFLSSREGISTNILANRLAKLEQNGILIKTPNESDRRKDLYSLTEKGLDLIPLMLEMVIWSAQHDVHTAAPADWISAANMDKESMLRLIRETVRQGGAIAAGPDSVLSKLRTPSK
jgi:DNA-binding HxlR family transcriptional regulator